MVTKLCCTAPQRSNSPETPNARGPSTPLVPNPSAVGTPQRHQPISAPPPEIGVIDGTELQRIFVAASLPEDHPHALKILGRKPDFDESIIRSPGFKHKVKRQLSRKSIRSDRSRKSEKSKSSGMTKSERWRGKIRLSLKRSKQLEPSLHEEAMQTASSLLEAKSLLAGGYDPDAQTVTSFEVINSVGERSDGLPQYPNGTNESRPVFGSVGSCHALREDDRRPRRSMIRSLEWLAPALRPRGSSPLPLSTPLVDSVRSFTIHTVATSSRPPTLLRASSSPNLTQIWANGVPARRSRSELDVCPLVSPLQCVKPTWMSVDKVYDDLPTPSGSIDAQASRQSSVSDANTEAGHGEATTETDFFDAGRLNPKAGSPTHLQDLAISKHLRTVSCASTGSEDVCIRASWTFHHRERSKIGLNGLCTSMSGHYRNDSSSGFGSAAVPDSWGKVVKLEPDAASSVYSRPSSAGCEDYVSTGIDGQLSEPYNLPYEPPINNANWPLPTTRFSDESSTEESDKFTTTDTMDTAGPRTAVTVDLDFKSKRSSHEAYCPTQSLDDGSSRSPSNGRSKWLPTKSSVSSINQRSRFLEAFTPPKRTVEKRRSLFKFLRPGSHRQTVRSTSTPALTAKPASLSRSMDGPSDDAGQWTVQYELSEHPRTRSASMHDFTIDIPNEAPGLLFVPGELERRPSPADYERRLSVAGDDRRRPSSINLEALEAIQTDDRRDSTHLKRKLSRAAPLRNMQEANPLMTQALEDHHLEKAAFFRSSTRRASSSGLTAPSFVLRRPSGGAGTSLLPSTLRGENDLLRRSMSMNQLRQPQNHLSESSQVDISDACPHLKTGTVSSPVQVHHWKTRAVTPLASWSRYPSHNRDQRCGSAGAVDSIITHDFALGLGRDNVQASDLAEAAGTTPSKRTKTPLPKSRSMTFGSVWRYYSNLLASASFAGQGRRTSVTIGGMLEYPELEMIAPVMPAEPHHHHHHYPHLHPPKLEHIKEHVKEDVGKLLHHAHPDGESQFHHSHHDGDSLFQYHKGKEPDRAGLARKDTSIGPMDRSGEVSNIPAEASDSPREDSKPTQGCNKAIEPPISNHHHGLAFDGSGESNYVNPTKTIQKAQQWSLMYKSCVQLPTFSDNVGSREKLPLLQDDSRLMPPPALKPPKPRSPEQPKLLDPNVRIRRFPSVTVMDDKKGQSRSISFLTVKTSSSDGSLRASTHDVIRRVKQRETEEIQRLMAAESDIKGGLLAC